MPENFKIRFRGWTGLDFSTARKITIPQRKPPSMGEETVLGGAITALSAAGNQKGRIAQQARDRIGAGANLELLGRIPGALMPSVRDYTFTEGLTGGGGAGVAYSLGGGIYMWRKHPGFDIGLYGSISIGLVTNIGGSGGVQIGYLFGPAPSVLAGDSIAISVTVDAGIVSIGGSLLLTAPPGGLTPTPTTGGISGRVGSMLSALAAAGRYTPQVVGVAYTISAGISVLPIDISVMPGRTWTRSIVSR
ncbi:hypothetical protein GCM10011371_20090 [Novosphingobium marinum]|uniref:Uncharacterized protein n=1 Tax=Novosphingobium marinum TaxID=1514948 RepID=A0A7Y9Y009_9SPHN|nr:hypothetical protein [Novosphingobium marinum]NYH96121.1 hypothetical protein [Novosphingobium marinum]GGC32652.1 hypothetical protein GCM10011371_20090 [Novosphingobium marinum]